MTSGSAGEPSLGRPDRASSATSLPHRVDTPSGEHLLFREVTPDDVPALERLYASLDAEATYRRFFTAVAPRGGFYERLARIADRDGCCIVAVDTDGSGDGSPAIVAEANFERVANGNAELAITVDQRWRGWLGPYLLGLLREQATERGIPNLEAEILTCNRPMRALTRRLGEVMFPQSDWQTVRVEVSSTGASPTWPRTAKPTVLVEMRSLNPDALGALTAQGYEVLACTGRRGNGPPCPFAQERGDCVLAATADVIVVAQADAAERERLLDGHRRRHPEVPLVAIELSPGHPLEGAELVAAVDRAGASRRSGP